MKLFLLRTGGTEGFTAGRLFIDGVFECFTLEDQLRDVKIKGETAIPAGTYRVIINMSSRFKKLMLLLLGVLHFSGIRIHAGETAADTSGCILVGCKRENEEGSILRQSRIANDRLFLKIQAALDAGEEVWITIRDDEKLSDLNAV